MWKALAYHHALSVYYHRPHPQNHFEAGCGLQVRPERGPETRSSEYSERQVYAPVAGVVAVASVLGAAAAVGVAGSEAEVAVAEQVVHVH